MGDKQYRTAVIVPNWNGAHLLKSCLDSLLAQRLPIDVIVVDNGSVDDSLGVLAKYKNITVLKNKENLGFSGGVNRGLRYCLDKDYTYAALFNNDAVADSKWSESLVRALNDNEEIGIATSKILLTDKKHFDTTGDFLSTWGLPFPRGRNELDTGQYDVEEKVFGACGGASMYRLSVLKKIGLFDENFFAYFEDVDLSFRAQSAGWEILYVPTAIVYHKLSATSSKLGNFILFHSTKNFLLLYVKNMPGRLFFKYLPKITLIFARMFAASIKHKKLGMFLKSILKFLQLLPSTLRKRMEIRRLRKLSVSQIDALLYKSKPPRSPVLEKVGVE